METCFENLYGRRPKLGVQLILEIIILLFQRKAFGSALFERHLGKTASDPVNVDSMARQTATENMGSGDQDVFSLAQLQVRQLLL